MQSCSQQLWVNALSLPPPPPQNSPDSPPLWGAALKWVRSANRAALLRASEAEWAVAGLRRTVLICVIMPHGPPAHGLPSDESVFAG